MTPEIQEKYLENQLQWLNQYQNEVNMYFTQQTQQIKMLKENIYRNNPHLRPETDTSDVLIVPSQDYNELIDSKAKLEEQSSDVSSEDEQEEDDQQPPPPATPFEFLHEKNEVVYNRFKANYNRLRHQIELQISDELTVDLLLETLNEPVNNIDQLRKKLYAVSTKLQTYRPLVWQISELTNMIRDIK